LPIEARIEWKRTSNVQWSAKVKRIPVERITEQFTHAVNSGDEKAAWSAANRALTDGLSVTEVYELVVLPSLATLSQRISERRTAADGRIIETLERILAKLHPNLPFHAGRPPHASVWVIADDSAERPLLEIRARVLTDLLGNDRWPTSPVKTDTEPISPPDAPEALIAIVSHEMDEIAIRAALAHALGDLQRVRTVIVGDAEEWSLQDLNVLTVPDEYQARRALKEVFTAELAGTSPHSDSALLCGQLSLSFESSDVLLCILDEQQKIVTANRVARDGFGFSAGEPIARYLDAGSRDIFEALLRGNDGTATQLVEVGFIRHGREYLTDVLLLQCGHNRAMLAYPKQEEVNRLTTILNNYNREINKLNRELREVRGQLRRQSGALDSANSQLGVTYDELNSCRLEDPLTGAFNKRYYTENLVNEINRARRYRRSLGFLLIDVDDFRQINEKYGHRAGDEVLRRIVNLASKHTRNGVDWIARVGDEEFVVVLPETDMEGCLQVGKKLRNLVASTPIEFGKHNIHATISVGGASYDALEDVPVSFQELTSRADEALDRARRDGPNNQHIEPIQ